MSLLHPDRNGFNIDGACQKSILNWPSVPRSAIANDATDNTTPSTKTNIRRFKLTSYSLLAGPPSGKFIRMGIEEIHAALGLHSGLKGVGSNRAPPHVAIQQTGWDILLPRA